jgi:hypothetical protein
MSIRRGCHLIALWMLAGVVVMAQSPAGNPAQDEQKQQEQLREKNARALLAELLSEILTLRLPENRVSLQLGAADLLWKEDQSAARTLYREAAAGISEIYRAHDPNEVTEEDGFSLRSLWDQLRFRMLTRVAERDVKLAQELMMATRPPELPGESGVAVGLEREFEIRIAIQLAETDPARAYQLAEEKLAGGASGATDEVLEYLRRLISKDAALATKLARSLLRKIQSESAGSHEPPYLLSRLLMIISAQGVESPETPKPGEQKNDPPRLDDAVIREAVELMTTRILALLSNQNPAQRSQSEWYALSELQRLVPLAEKYAPGRLAGIRARLSELKKGLSPEVRVMLEMDALFQKDDQDAVLAAAAKLPKEQSQGIYYRLVEEAIGKGEPDRARRIMDEHLKDPAVRRQLEIHLEQNAVQTALNKGKLEEVRPLMSKVRSTRERVGILTRMAETELARGNKKEAEQLLAEARDLAGNRATGRAQLEAQLELATGYAKIDPARSFELLEGAVNRINELVAAAATLDGFFPFSQFRQDEMIMLEEGSGPFVELVREQAETLRLLLTVDFDHVRSVIAAYQRPEIRAFIRLAIVESVLTNHPEATQGPRMGRISSAAVRVY